MMARNDGGPAFPVIAGHTVYTHGMTLRDAAALAALQGILANPNDSYGPGNMIHAVCRALEAADAFIAAREAE